ncbi:MAG: copper chaperone PCu(A)C [Gallionellaceae bacterium]|jgi:copper(I)-binding protein
MNIKYINSFAASILLLCAAQAYAGDVTVSDVWSRASAPGQSNGSVGLVITSTKDARLIAVSSPAAESAEIHTMSMDNGVMKMRELEFLSLPANQAVKLGPGGNHLMLFGLKKPLQAGKEIPLTLTIQFADKHSEKISIKSKIKALDSEYGKH